MKLNYQKKLGSIRNEKEQWYGNNKINFDGGFNSGCGCNWCVFYTQKYREVKAETIRTDMLQVQWKLKDYIDKQTVKGEEKKYLGTKVSEMQDNEIIKDFLAKKIISEEEYDKYYVLQDENLAEAGLEITNYEGSYFLINYNTYEVIDTKGYNKSDDEVLYKLTDINKKDNENTTSENDNTVERNNRK